jgi:transposase
MSVPRRACPRTRWQRPPDGADQRRGEPDARKGYRPGIRARCLPGRDSRPTYHLMVMAGEAVDDVRKQMQRSGAQLRGSLWALRGNEWNLTAEQALKRAELTAAYKPLGRALALRSALQDVYCAPDVDGPDLLRWWCQWARSRLKPFRKLAKTIRQYWAGIASYFKHHITRGAIEAINGIIRLAKRRARGFRNFIHLRTIAYWSTGHLALNLPPLHPLETAKRQKYRCIRGYCET